MANLPEVDQWDGVYQFEIDDLLQGGPNGIDNAPLKNLANRTLFLKNRLPVLPGDVAYGVTDIPADDATKLATAKCVFDGIDAALTGSSFSAVQGSNGYQKFPNGTMMQWMNGSASNNSDILFPVAFPTACWGLTLGDKSVTNELIYTDILSFDQLTNTGFRFRARDADGTVSGGTGFFCLAFGN